MKRLLAVFAVGLFAVTSFPIQPPPAAALTWEGTPLTGEWNGGDMLFLPKKALRQEPTDSKMGFGDIQIGGPDEGLFGQVQDQVQPESLDNVWDTALSAFCYHDRNGDGAMNLNDPRYLASSCGNGGTRLRLDYESGYAPGSSVRAIDYDAAHPLSSVPGGGSWNFYDPNGNGKLDDGESVYLDGGSDGIVSAGDIRVTNPTYRPGSIVSPGDSDVGRAMPHAGLFAVGSVEKYVDMDIGKWTTGPYIDHTYLSLGVEYGGGRLVNVTYQWRAFFQPQVHRISITFPPELQLVEGVPEIVIPPTDSAGSGKLSFKATKLTSYSVLGSYFSASLDGELTRFAEAHFYYDELGIFRIGQRLPNPAPGTFGEFDLGPFELQSGSPNQGSTATATGCVLNLRVVHPQFPDDHTTEDVDESLRTRNLTVPYAFIRVFDGDNLIRGQTDAGGRVSIPTGTPCGAEVRVEALAATLDPEESDYRNHVVSVCRRVIGCDLIASSWTFIPTGVAERRLIVSSAYSPAYRLQEQAASSHFFMKELGYTVDHPATVIFKPGEGTSLDDGGSFYLSNRIEIDGRGDDAWTDTMLHEWGHHLHHFLIEHKKIPDFTLWDWTVTTRPDQPPDVKYGSNYRYDRVNDVDQVTALGGHSWNSVHDTMGSAFVEGFADFFKGVALNQVYGVPTGEVDGGLYDNPAKYDFPNQTRKEWHLVGGDRTWGPYRDGSVTGALWKLYTTPHTGDATALERFDRMADMMYRTNPQGIFHFFQDWLKEPTVQPTAELIDSLRKLHVPLKGDLTTGMDLPDAPTGSLPTVPYGKFEGGVTYQCLFCSNPDEADSFKAPVRAAETLSLDVRRSGVTLPASDSGNSVSSNDNPAIFRVRLYNPSGTLLEDRTTESGTASIDYLAGVTGDYVISISRYGSEWGNEGTYEIDMAARELPDINAILHTSFPTSGIKENLVTFKWTVTGTGSILETFFKAKMGTAEFQITPTTPTGNAPQLFEATFKLPSTTGTMDVSACARNAIEFRCSNPASFSVLVGQVMSVTVDSAPASAPAGSIIDVCWSVAGTGQMTHGHVHYGSSSGRHPHGTLEQSGTMPGAFCDEVGTSSVSSVFLVAHASAESESTISSAASQEAEVILTSQVDSVTLHALPSTARVGEQITVCWDIAGSGETPSSGIEISQGATPEIVGGSSPDDYLPATSCATVSFADAGTYQFVASATGGSQTVRSGSRQIQISADGTENGVFWTRFPTHVTAGSSFEVCWAVFASGGSDSDRWTRLHWIEEAENPQAGTRGRGGDSERAGNFPSGQEHCKTFTARNSPVVGKWYFVANGGWRNCQVGPDGYDCIGNDYESVEIIVNTG